MLARAIPKAGNNLKHAKFKNLSSEATSFLASRVVFGYLRFKGKITVYNTDKSLKSVSNEIIARNVASARLSH